MEDIVKCELTELAWDTGKNEEDINEEDEDDFGKLEARPNLIWTTIATKTFLDLVQLMLPQIGWKFRTKKQMWKIITKKMDAKGFDFTQTQIENKWKDLYRSYRAHAEQLRRGKVRITSKTQIYTKWPDLFPLAAVRTIKNRKSIHNQTKLYDETNIKPEPSENDENFPELHYETSADGTNPLDEEENSSIERNMLEKERNSSCDDMREQAIPQSETLRPKHKMLTTFSNSNMALHLIAEEIATLRQENLKLKKEKIQIQKQQLDAYKERTAEISKVGKGFMELLEYLKEKIPDGKK